MFSAGVVSATLEGNFRPAAFMAFNSAMGKAHASMDLVEGKSRKAGAEMDRAGKAAAFMGKASASAAAGGLLAVGLGLVKSAQAAIDFEKSMRNVNSIAGLSEGKFRDLSKSVLELSGKTAQAPKTLAEGLYQLVSSGFDAKDSLVILKSSAKAATAGLTDTETATTAVAAALNSYHLKAKDAADISDILFQTVNRGVISFPELAQTIGTVLPFASSLHIGLNQVGASISTLTKEGIPAAEATTYLKNAMVQFLKPSDALAAAIKKTGFESGEALVKSKGFQGALDAVAKTSDGTKGALQTMFPDIRASAAVFALTGKNAKTAADDLRNFSAAATAGSTEKVFKEQSKSVAFQMQQLKANLSVLGIEVGSALLPALNEGTRAVSKFVAEMNSGTGTGGKFVDDLEAVRDAASGVASALGPAAGAIAGIVGTIASIKIGNLKDEVLGLGGAFKIIGGVLSGNLGQVFGGIGDLLKGAASSIIGTISTILGAVGTLTGVLAKIDPTGIFGGVSSAAKAGQHALDDFRQSIRDIGKEKPKPVQISVAADATSAMAVLRKVNSVGLGKKVMKVLGDKTDADAKIRALEALGIKPKDARVLAKVSDALYGISSVKAAMSTLQDRTVTITTRQIHTAENTGAFTHGPARRASGRRPGGSELALTGEEPGHPELVGNQRDGWSLVTQPTMMNLRPEDAVVPTNPAYAGRALGMMFAAMGVPGYAKGKKPKLAVPDAVRYGGVSEDSILSARDNAREDYQKRKGNVHDLDVKIRDQEKKVASTKGKAHDTARAKLRDLKKDRAHYSGGGGGLHSLSWMRQHYEDLAKQAQVLHATNLEIDRLDKVQSTDRTKMETASKRGDAGAWGTAKKDRDGILSKLKSAYKQALKYAKPGSNFAADLEGKLADIDSQIADAGSDAFAGPDMSDGMTDAERARYGALQAQQSLAALTAGLGDDQAAAQNIETFLSTVLGEVLADPDNRGGSAAVSSVADALKQARDNVASFSSSGSQNADADLQAQLDQQRTRADAAERNAQINAQALSVFQGAGDIGQGPTMVQNIYTMHPGDPRTNAIVADSAASGFSQQAARTTPRTNLGL